MTLKKGLASEPLRAATASVAQMSCIEHAQERIDVAPQRPNTCTLHHSRHNCIVHTHSRIHTVQTHTVTHHCPVHTSSHSHMKMPTGHLSLPLDRPEKQGQRTTAAVFCTISISARHQHALTCTLLLHSSPQFMQAGRDVRIAHGRVVDGAACSATPTLCCSPAAAQSFGFGSSAGLVAPLPC